MKKFDYKSSNICFVLVSIILLAALFLVSIFQFIKANTELSQGDTSFLSIMDAWLHPVDGFDTYWKTPPLWNFFAMLFIFLNLIFVPVLILLMIFFLNSYKFENFLSFSYIVAIVYLLISTIAAGVGLKADYIASVCPMNKYIFYLNISSLVLISIFLLINIFVFNFRFRH